MIVMASDKRAPVLATIQRHHADNKEFGGNRLATLDRDGYKCVTCGMSNAEHVRRWNRTLTIDHIDGQGRGNKTPNNDLKNLQTLCLPCHGAKDGPRADYGKRNHAAGERNGNAKMTPSGVLDMRRERGEGVLLKVLAARYGVSVSVTHAICTGRTWRNVTAGS